MVRKISMGRLCTAAMEFELDFMQKVLAPHPSCLFSIKSKVLTEISPHIIGNIHFSRKPTPIVREEILNSMGV